MENREIMECSIMDEVREMRRKISEEFGHDLNQLVGYYQGLENEMRKSGKYKLADSPSKDTEHERDVWNKTSEDAIRSIKDSISSLRQKVLVIRDDTRTQSNELLKHAIVQYGEVDSAARQICNSGNIALDALRASDPLLVVLTLGPSSITVAFLTRYLIELYGVLKYLEENSEDGMDEWLRYNEIKLAEWSESINNLGLLKKEFTHIHESLQTGKKEVLKEMSDRGLNIKNIRTVKSLLENTNFVDTATQIGTEYYQCYQYLSKFTHPTLVGMYSTAADSPEVLHVCIGLTKALMDDFNQLYANLINKFGIESTS